MRSKFLGGLIAILLAGPTYAQSGPVTFSQFVMNTPVDATPASTDVIPIVPSSAATEKVTLGSLQSYLFGQVSGGLTMSAAGVGYLSVPSVGTLGGIYSQTPVSHNFLTGVNTSGQPTYAQPAYTDISGLGTIATKSATSGQSLLEGDGAGGLANVTIGTCLSLSSGTLSSACSGTVSSVSVASANGFSATVLTPTTTPNINMGVTITGITKGVSGALAAATAGTDFVAPGGALGTPSSGTATNLTGLPLTTGVTGILPGANGGTGVANTGKTITLGGNLTTSGAFATTLTETGTTNVTLPTSGTLISSSTALSGPCTGTPSTTTFLRGDCTWSAPPLPALNGYINGLGLSNDGTTPNSVLDIAAGVATDSTNVISIVGTAFTKSTAGTWVSGSGNNGMGTGLTVTASTWYHVYAIINGGNYDVYFDTSATAANKPASTTAFRYIGSFWVDASTHIATFVQNGQRVKYTLSSFTDLSAGSATAATAVTLHTPPGFVTFPTLNLSETQATAGAANQATILGPTSGGLGECYITAAVASVTATMQCSTTTNTSSQIYYIVNVATTALTIQTIGYTNPHLAPNF